MSSHQDNFSSYHIPVLLNEVIEGLSVIRNAKYIDCNLGGGGHTSEILSLGGKVVGIDLDENAIKHCKERFSSQIQFGQLQIFHDNFRNISKIVESAGWKEGEVSGILYDLGISSYQLRHEDQGFSFVDEGPLDMRMDKSSGVKAIDLIAALSEAQLAKIIFEYGEDPQAKRFAKTIKYAYERYGDKLTAASLAELIKKSSAYDKSRIHPATRVFQALRIAVNSELDNLDESLERATQILRPGGRLLIISFHSLEDKIAKNLSWLPALRKINKKPIVPSQQEVDKNPSARSAKLRIYEKQ